MANVVVPPFTEAPSTVVGGTPTSVFPFDFPFWAAADIVVYIDDALLASSAYSVEGFAIQDSEAVEGGYGSGEVTLDTAVSNVTVTIDRLVVGDRQTQFSRSVPLAMPALNSDLNRVTARQQDLRRRQAALEALGLDATQITAELAAAVAARNAAQSAQGLSETARDAAEAFALASDSTTRAAKAANLADLADPAAARANIGADLAANVNFTPAGTGAASDTVQNRLRDQAASIESYQLGGTSDNAALVLAATARREIKLKEGKTYVLDATADLSALSGRTVFMNGARIEAAPGFIGACFMVRPVDMRLIGPGTFDGTNVPGPSTASATISGITKANPGVVTTTSPHGFNEYEIVEIAGVGGMTALNFATNGGERYVVLNPTATTFQLGNIIEPTTINTSAMGTYTSGGTASLVDAYNAVGHRGTALFVTGSGSGGSVEGITFENFKSGAVNCDSRYTRDGFVVADCNYVNCQTYTANETAPLVNLFGTTRGVIRDCRADGYNWKGYYVADGYLCKMVRCHAEGGVDGHASHYITGGADNALEDCSHTGVAGVGFGWKCFNTQRPVIRNFISLDARAGGNMFGADDLVIDTMQIVNPTISALLIEGSASYGAATRGLIRGVKVRRKVLGSDANGRAIYVAASTKLSRTVSGATKTNPVVITTSTGHFFNEGERAYFAGVGGMTQLNGNSYRVRNPTVTTFELYSDTGPVDGTAFGTFTSGGTATCGAEIDKLTIRDGHFENCLWGVHIANTGAQQTNIHILDNEFVNCGQYGILGYMGSGRIAGNRFRMDGAAVEAVIHIESDGFTSDGVLEIADNELLGCTGTNIELLTRLNYRAIRVINNRGHGGARLISYNGDGNAADTVSLLEIRGNEHTGLTANGSSLTFNTTTATRLINEGNSLVNASYVPVADSYTNLTNLSIMGVLTHSGSPESVFAAPVGAQFRRTDGGAATSFYVKESGTGNTGWIAK